MPADPHAPTPSPGSGPSPGRRLRAGWRSLRRRVLAHRRLLAAVLAALAVTAGLRASTPPAPAAETVLVAAHDLAPGAVLAASDLRPTTVPATLVPPRPVAMPEGRVLATGLDAGEPITQTRLVGPGLVERAAGLVAVPVRIPDPAMASLLQVGDRIDLLAADLQAGTTGSATTVASGVPVLALGLETQASGVAALPGRLVVVGAEPEQVGAVAQASAASFVTFAWSQE